MSPFALKNIRLEILSIALALLILMDAYLIYLGYKMQTESGIAVGLGVVELTFFTLATPISIMTLLLKPGRMYMAALGMVWLILIYFFISY